MRKRKLFCYLFALFFCSLLARAEEDSPTFQNGHNLTYTSDTLKPGHCSLGLPVTACGILPGISLGASPWMHIDYGMMSLALRALVHENENGDRWAIQANYFKTYKDRGTSLSWYQMEALWLIFIRTWAINDHYRLHANLQTNYYIDEKLPFSLRRPYLKQSPFQFNFSLLHQTELAAGWFILGETGLLDFARIPTHIHGGASMGKRIGGFTVRAGFSVTGTLGGLFMPSARGDYQQILRGSVEGYEGSLSSSRIAYDYAIHPEFALQFTF